MSAACGICGSTEHHTMWHEENLSLNPPTDRPSELKDYLEKTPNGAVFHIPAEALYSYVSQQVEAALASSRQAKRSPDAKLNNGGQ